MRTIATKLVLVVLLVAGAAIAQQFPCADIPALTGDATTSAGSCATTVNALKNVSLPSLSAGYLHYTGSAFAWDSPSFTQVYPGAGVANSTGSAWETSYTVGTGANDLVQLNGSGYLPSLNGSLLTSLPSPKRICAMNVRRRHRHVGCGRLRRFLVSQCYNDFGATVTVLAVRCFCDNSSCTTTVNPKVTGGSSLLSGALTCSTSWASGTLSGTPTLTTGSTFDMVATPDGTTKLLHVEVTVQ